MTLVVTYAEEHLACFTKDANGKLTQRALLHTGAGVPTAIELATIGEELSERFRWNGNGIKSKRAIEAPPIRVIERKSRGKARKATARGEERKPRVTPATTDEIQERMDFILSYLREHPQSTINDVLAGYGINPIDAWAKGRWNWYFNRLLGSGQIRRWQTDRQGKPYGYEVV